MFTGPGIRDQSDRSPWARSVESRLSKVLARIGTQDIVDRAVTAAKLAVDIPLGEIAYNQDTTGGQAITVVTDLIGMGVLLTVPAGRRIKITAHLLVQATGGPVVTLGEILRDGDILGRFTTDSVVDQAYLTAEGSVDDSPPAGTYTYKARMTRALGTGTINTVGGVGFPNFIRVEDVGSA